jgi:GntR family galactonate operon transcriptional repressor
VTAGEGDESPAQRPVFLSSAVRTPAARLGVAVVWDLVTAIVTGELTPGEVLPPEGVLSQRFGVSRTVIRESVKRIEEKGLVVVAQGRGTTVNPPSMWNVLDPVILSAMVDHDDTLGVLDELSIVRGSLEASMARAAAEQRTPERTAELRAAYEETVKRVGDFDAYNEADAAFHYVIMEQSGNRLAANITRILFARARESSRFTGVPAPEAMTATLDEHRAIYEAIAAGDADGAAQATRDHISRAWARRRPPYPMRANG